MFYHNPGDGTKVMLHAQNHGGSNAGSSRSRALRHRGRGVAMDPASMGMVSGPSIPGGHSVLEAMLFAAAPDEAGIWRTSANDGNGLWGPLGDRSHEVFEPFPLEGEVKSQPINNKQPAESIIVESIQQEFKAKEAIEQATARSSSSRHHSRSQRTCQRRRKRKNRVGSNGKWSKDTTPQPTDAKQPLKDIVRLALNPRWIEGAKRRLKERLYAASTMATKESKRRKIMEIMQNCEIKIQGNGLSVEELVTVAAVLGESNIKSADQYLSEVKLLQLEAGISWSDVMERQMTMVKRALKRDVGPENRAKEFDPANISQEVWESQSSDGNRPRRVAWSYTWAVVWMLRSIELAAMRLGDVHMEFSKKTVTLLIRKSKTDQRALGVKRTLVCCGLPTCLRLCPWNLALRVLADHDGDDENAPLFPDKKGRLVPKVKVIKAWMENIDPEITGHSGRRSGAMWYARRGLPVHEIGLLGRWKSSAVFRYIEEALQEIPLNAGAHKVEALGGAWASPTTPAPPQLTEEDKEKLVPVPNAPKQRAICVKPPGPEQCWAVSSGRNGRVSHRIRKASWNVSLAAWDTWCGWHFAERNVKVMITPKHMSGTNRCKKCEAAFQSCDKVTGGVSLAQLVSWKDDAAST